MKNKYCIFNKNKLCDDCGECYKCELDPNKICNNCGKCLELEGYDIKEIKIDKILRTEDEIKEYNETYIPLQQKNQYTKQENELIAKFKEKYNIYESDTDKEEKENIKLGYIEDNYELMEMLKNKKEHKDEIAELYPGLIKVKKKR